MERRGRCALIDLGSSNFLFKLRFVALTCIPQFGWDPDAPDIWIPRRDALFSILQSNPKAKFVTRTVQFGSEPLYDWAIDPPDLAAQVKAAKTKLAPLGIPITVSEMAWGYQVVGSSLILRFSVS